MRYVLAGWLLFMMVAEVFQWDVSMGPGLSVKNAVLYLIAMFLMFRIVVVHNHKLEAGPIHVCFAVLIVYAIATWLIAGLIVEYPRYDLINERHPPEERPDRLLHLLPGFLPRHELADATRRRS